LPLSDTDTKKDFRWGDDDDEEFLGGTDEGRFETKPDAKGVKVITDLQLRDGKRIKITRKVRVVKKVIRVNKRAEERKAGWVRFGKAKENTGDITVKEAPIPFDISGKRRTMHTNTQKKIEEEIMKMMRQSAAKAAGATVTDETEKYVPKSMRPGGGGARTSEAPRATAEPAGNTYRPPSMRDGSGGGGRTMGGGRDDPMHTVRVTNLSEDITEQDLRDLFGTYGALQRVFLVKDKISRESKGFAFVTFYTRADAEKAIEKVSGFGYNHLILQVEWARPSGT